MLSNLVRWVVCVIAMTVLSVTSAQAQVDPRGAHRTIRTEHFRVHFPESHEALARRAASLAETAWNQLAEELVTPDVPIEMLVVDNLDITNGFATPFPSNRITIYALPPVMVPELRHYDDWLQLVVTHELVHIFHLDRARGWWAAGRKILGRNPIFLPNAYLPSWVIEGLAVHYETKLTGSGRLASTEFPMIARAAALSGKVPVPSMWSLSTSRFPLGQHAYGYGSMLMQQLIANSPPGGTRRFVESVAGHPIPWRVNRAVKDAFGTSINRAFTTFSDSLGVVATGTREWAARDTVRRLSAFGMTWFAAQPQWESDSTVLLAVNNGEDVGGVYRAHVTATSIDLTRVSRRNSMDATSPRGDGSNVFAQLEYDDPFVIRSRLWHTDQSGRETEIAGTSRVVLPHARTSDGAIVAVRLEPGTTSLVRVARDGAVRPLTLGSLDTAYAEPRWSPDGARLVAVRLIRGAEQQVVVLDTLGRDVVVVSSDRAINTVPTFTPDGQHVIWTSDQLGSQQLMRATVAECSVRCEPRVLTLSTTGIGSPSVSPDGTRIAAIEYTLQGQRLVIVPMHSGYPLSGVNAVPRLPSVAPYASTMRIVRVHADSGSSTVASTPYRAFRQLLPRWWMPLIGEGSAGGTTYGLSSSGLDILGRHAWAAQSTYDPARREIEGGAVYRYRALPRTYGWQPLLDISGVQNWDRFPVIDTGRVLLGELQRVTRTYSTGVTFSRPRIRTSSSLTVGAQLETRDYLTDPPALVKRLDPVYERGRSQPGVFAAFSFGNTMRAGRAISLEDGFNFSTSLQHRWRSGILEQRSVRAVSTLRGYKALDFGGFSRHAVAARVSAGAVDQHAWSELSIGGVSGASAELIPGVLVGDPSRQFPVRGFEPGVQFGSRAITGSAEYRAPLALVARGIGLVPLFLDRTSLSVFTDAGRAWCSGDVRASVSAPALCLPSRVRDGWLASVGAELNMDIGVQWDVPYRLRLGLAQPVARPFGLSGKGTVYVTLGSSF